MSSINSNKSTIAIFTPLPPIKSGIADYFIKLLSKLLEHYDCDIFTDTNYTPSVPSFDTKQTLNIYKYSSFYEKYKNYRKIIYQLGNSTYHKYMLDIMQKYPGIVILHDLNLHSLTRTYNTREEYIKILGHDYTNPMDVLERIERGNHSIHDIIVNRYYLQTAKHIIVHNHLSYNYLIKSGYINVSMFKLPVNLPDIDDKIFNKTTLTLASFGIPHSLKCIDTCIQALTYISKLKHRYSIKYNIVGDNNTYTMQLKTLIRNLHLSNTVKICGYVDCNTYINHLINTDLCLSIRKKTNGETSASLLDALAYGIPTITSNIDSFDELPDSIIMKVRPEATSRDLARAISHLVQDKSLRQQYSANSRKYVKEEHSLDRYAKGLKNIISSTTYILDNRYKPTYFSPLVLQPATPQHKAKVSNSIERLAANRELMNAKQTNRLHRRSRI